MDVPASGGLSRVSRAQAEYDEDGSGEIDDREFEDLIRTGSPLRGVQQQPP